MKLLFITNALTLSRDEIVDIISNQLEDSKIVFGTQFINGFIGATFQQPNSDIPVLIKILEENGFRVLSDGKKLVVNATNNRKLKRAVKYTL